MATITITSSNWDVGQIRITYTALNGTLTITEIEGKRGGGYRSWDASDTSITVSVGGTNKSISLSHCIDFGNNTWTSWGATDTSWTGLTGTSISISTTMPASSTIAYDRAKFTDNATMSWSTYTVSYNANGGSGAPSSQTKTHGTALTLSSTKPTRNGYIFVGWGTSASDTTSDYSAGGSYTTNADETLYAIWKKTITLSYNANGGSGAPSSQSETVYNATTSYKFTISNTKPTRSGYTFLGWSTSNTATSSSYSSGGNITLSSSDELYAVWSEHKLTVNYYSNYATYATYQGNEKTVSASTNVLVHSQDFYYDNAASSGLVDIQNANYLYLSRIGYTPTGNWGTSTSGGTLINQSTTYSTGQALAQALGKNLTSGNASINIYPQWQINTYTIKYNANKGYGNMNSQSVQWNGDFTLSNNTFKREGYKFVGWNVRRDSDNTWYVIGQGWKTENEIIVNGYEKKIYENQVELTFNNSWVSGNEYTISEYTLYAIWEIAGVVYIDNGTTFEPYLTYIDNGTDWELYLVYIDNGEDWNIVS